MQYPVMVLTQWKYVQNLQPCAKRFLTPVVKLVTAIANLWGFSVKRAGMKKLETVLLKWQMTQDVLAMDVKYPMESRSAVVRPKNVSWLHQSPIKTLPYKNITLLLIHSIFLIQFNELDIFKVSPRNVTQKFCGHLRRVGWKRRARGGTDIQKWKRFGEFQWTMQLLKIFNEYSNASTLKKQSAIRRGLIFPRHAQNHLVTCAKKVN